MDITAALTRQNHPLLERAAHVYTQQMIWGDMDAFGHLNNVHFYRYFESARISAMELYGSFGSEGKVVIAKSSCKFLRPVVFPDVLHVGVTLSRLGGSSLTMVYTMVSEAQGAVVAIGDSVNVFIDDEGKPTPMTQGVRDRFASWVVPEAE